MNAAQHFVMGGLLARDWLALVAVEAFVDTARGGGIRGRSNYKKNVHRVQSPTEESEAESRGSRKLRTFNNNNCQDLLVYGKIKSEK